MAVLKGSLLSAEDRFNVVFDNRNRCTPTTCSKIRRSPERIPPPLHNRLRMEGYFFFRIRRLDTLFQRID